MNVTAAELVLLSLAALAAGVVDAIAGGGGLITLPALLSVGLPPHLALGTNKGQAVWGSGAALATFARARALDLRRARIAFPCGLAGSLAGAALVLALEPTILRPLVLVLLIAVAVVLTFRRAPAPPREDAPPSVPPARAPADGEPARALHAVRRAGLWVALIALVIGAYDGFFGPGTGTFLIVAYNLVLHVPLVAASADAKVVNFASNLAAVGLFAWRGVILWEIALPMAAAQLVGGMLGARLALRGGDRRVRRVVLVVVVALTVRLGHDLVAPRPVEQEHGRGRGGEHAHAVSANTNTRASVA